MNKWTEMSYALYPILSQHERLNYEFEMDIDVDDFDINEYLDNEEE